MSGHYSRNKGKRNEYLLRDSLRAEGYTSNRVPSSGAAEGFKGDVTFERGGIERVAELKVRKDEFKHIYAAYDNYAVDGEFNVAIPTDKGLACISVSDTMEKAVNGMHSYTIAARLADDKVAVKAIRKLVNIAPMIGKCDILVIRNDRKPFLYVGYRY